MKTQAVLIVLALLIIGAGWYLISGRNYNSQNVTPNQTTNTSGMSLEKKNVKTFEIEGKPFEFSLKEIRVKKGDTVRVVFKNTQGFHDWVLDGFNVKTKQIQAGESDTTEFTADKVGIFEYHCSVDGHREKGMVGNLIVEE